MQVDNLSCSNSLRRSSTASVAAFTVKCLARIAIDGALIPVNQGSYANLSEGTFKRNDDANRPEHSFYDCADNASVDA